MEKIFYIIIFIFILHMIYIRSYKRSKHTKYRVILVNRATIISRIFSLLLVIFLFSSKTYTMYIYNVINSNHLTFLDVFILVGLTSLLVYRSYLEIQDDVITDDELFIREGNYNLANLESYIWNISHELKFSRSDIRYDELHLKVRSTNLYQRTFKGKENFEIKLYVGKEDVNLVSEIIDKHIDNGLVTSD